ncbi:MAG: hypothetical protein RJA63_2479, partial [Pseudomonadota bacterium]
MTRVLTVAASLLLMSHLLVAC